MHRPRYISISNLVLLALIILSCAAFRLPTLLDGNSVVSTLDPDSDQYLQFANHLLGRQHVQVGAITAYPEGSVVRTPGYPILLAPIITLSGANLANAIILGHLFYWLLAVAFLIRSLRRDLPAKFVAILAILATLPMTHYLHMLVTEWSTFLLLLMIYAAIVRVRREPTKASWLTISLGFGFLSLVRPDYAFAIALIPLLAVGTTKRWRQGLTACLLALTLPLSWCVYNNFRLSEFTLSPLGKVGFFAVSSSIGTPDLSHPISSGALELANSINNQAVSISWQDSIKLIWFDASAQFGAFGQVDKIAHEIRVRESLSWLEFFSILGDYGRTVIRSHPGRYLLFSVCGIMTLIWSIPLILPLVSWSTGGSFLQRAKSPLGFALVAMLAIHGLHTILISLINIQHLRYYAPSFFACCLASAVLWVSLHWIQAKREVASSC